MEKLTFDSVVIKMKDLIGKTWKIVIIPYILMAIYSVYTTAFTDVYKGFDNPNVVSAMGIETMMSKLALMYLNIGIILVITGLLALFVITTFHHADQSKSLAPMVLIAQSVKCLPRVIGGYLIIALCFLGAIIVLTLLSVLGMMWLVPIGVLLIIVEFVFFLFLYYFFSMSAYILIIEKKTFILRRSIDIFKNSKGLLAIYFAVMVGVSIAVSMITMPAQMINNEVIKLLATILSSGISIIVGPLLTAFGLIMYNEIIRKEERQPIIEATEREGLVE